MSNFIGITPFMHVEDVPPLGVESVRLLDIDDQLKPKLDSLPQASRTRPADQTHGRREFTISAPYGNLAIFGRSIFGMPR